MRLLSFLSKEDTLPHCLICPIAKQSKLGFSHSQTKSSCVFELIHMDIWGLFHISTYNGEKYFFNIIYNFSRGTWIFLMHSKMDALGMIRAFHLMVETQFSTKVKIGRTNNATVFYNTTCKQLFHSLEIIHQSSCSYTPQQNGIVERKHRHFLNVARPLKFQSSIPLRYWKSCIITDLYFINRSPTPILYNKTQFEILFHKTPTFEHLRTFGCLCYIFALPIGHKFSHRATRCVFLGYSMV